MIRLSFVLLAFLAACAPQSGGLVSRETGLAGRFSDQVVISDDVHHVLLGHVIIANRDGETTRALIVSQRRDGVHRLRFSEVWMDGVALPYRRAGALDGCTHGHCRDNHVGMIFLSEQLFTHAQTHGLQARMIGGQGNVDIAVPARLFALPGL